MSTSPAVQALSPARRLRRQYLHVFAAAACVGPFLSFVLAGQGWPPSHIGVTAALLTAGGVVTAPWWGRLDDRHPGRAARVSLLAATGAAVLLAVALQTSEVPLVWAGALLLGAASGSLDPLLTSAALRDAGTAAALGRIRSAGSVGWILGLAAGGAVLTFAPESAAVVLVAALATLTAPRPKAHPGDATPEPHPTTHPDHAARPHPHGPAWRRAVLVLSLTLPIPITTSAFVYFTAGWARSELGAGPLLAVAPLALAAALELPAFVLVDRFARRLRPIDLVLLAYPPLIVAAALVALIPELVTLLAVQVLVAVAFALWFVGQSRLIAEMSPPGQMASGQALIANLSRGIAGPLAGLAGGVLATGLGYTGMFATLAALAIAGALRVTLVRRRPTLAR